MSVIDCSVHSTPYISCLKSKGVTAVIRYYARQKQTNYPQKILEPAEAQALSKAKISIGAVYQFNARSDEKFNIGQGQSDGEFARKYAAQTIRQPEGSTIYFGVDYDVSTAVIESNVVPHFEGLAAAMAAKKDYATFDVGVYGGWKVCDRLSKAGLVKYTWLSQSTGWGGSSDRKKYVDLKAWDLLQAMPRNDLCPGLNYDPNTVKQDLKSFGQFVVPLT